MEYVEYSMLFGTKAQHWDQYVIQRRQKEKRKKKW